MPNKELDMNEYLWYPWFRKSVKYFLKDLKVFLSHQSFSFKWMIVELMFGKKTAIISRCHIHGCSIYNTTKNNMICYGNYISGRGDYVLDNTMVNIIPFDKVNYDVK